MGWQIASVAILLVMGSACGFLLYKGKLHSATFTAILIVIIGFIFASTFVDRIAKIAFGEGHEVLMRSIEKKAYAQLDHVRQATESMVEFQALTASYNYNLSLEKLHELINIRDNLISSLENLDSRSDFISDIMQKLNDQIYVCLKSQITVRLGSGGNVCFNNEYNKLIVAKRVDYAALRELFISYEKHGYDLKKFDPLIDNLEHFDRYQALPNHSKNGNFR